MEFKPLSTWCFLVSFAEESGKGETTCWGSQNNYLLYKMLVDQGKVIFCLHAASEKKKGQCAIVFRKSILTYLIVTR